MIDRGKFFCYCFLMECFNFVCFSKFYPRKIVEFDLLLVFVGGFNPYSSNVTFLYSLKTSENRGFSDVCRGYRNVTLGEYGLNK